MCGLFAHNYNDNNLSEETNKILFHRGPDFHNYINIKNFTIGHNLLSIRGSIELSKQPKITKGGRYIFAFNGQIYNTSEICNKFGINFHNNIDTLILSDLIDLEGKNFISYIDGMFSIILFDKKKMKFMPIEIIAVKNLFITTIIMENILFVQKLNQF